MGPPLTSLQVPTITNFSLFWTHLTPLGSCFPCLVCLFLLSSSSSNISLCWLPQDPLEFSGQLQCLPYLLKMNVHELASPAKHRDSRTGIVLFHFCILCLALYLKHKFSWNVCRINEFALIMLPFLQIQNGDVRLPCLQGFSQPWYSMVLQSCLKSHRDKSPRFYRPKQTQMLTEYKLFNL